jgi:hypothetical protein
MREKLPTKEGGVLPTFLVPETTVRDAGTGPQLSLDEHAGQVVLLTLGITRIIEQESLDVSVWGSADGADWGTKQLVAFPQKFYCGTYQIVLDLTEQPDIKYLRAKWQVGRWGKGNPKPLFTIYLFAQGIEQRTLAVSA